MYANLVASDRGVDNHLFDTSDNLTTLSFDADTDSTLVPG